MALGVDSRRGVQEESRTPMGIVQTLLSRKGGGGGDHSESVGTEERKGAYKGKDGG